jgi:hypothetical protein
MEPDLALVALYHSAFVLLGSTDTHDNALLVTTFIFFLLVVVLRNLLHDFDSRLFFK